MSRSSTLAMCMTLCFLAPARAEIITVTSDSGGTGGPDCTLRDAITAANTDTPTGGCPAGSGADTIELPADAIILLTEADNETEGSNGLPSIISEIIINGNGATIQREETAPTFRIVQLSFGGHLTLNGVTISGGDVGANLGGGIRNGGTLTLSSSIVSGNSAVGGGGILNSGLLTLTNSTVSENSASIAAGGGIINWPSGTVALTNSTVSGNSTVAHGGGIRNAGTLLLSNSTVSGNSADTAGGGISNGGTLTMTNSTVSGNTANGSGGIDNTGMLILTNSTVRGNSADTAGGGISNAGMLTLTNSSVTGNSAGSAGGGIINYGGTVTLTNSTICGNMPDQIDGPWTDNGGNLITDKCPPCPSSDLNDDRFVDAADLAQLLGTWGPCAEPCEPGDPEETCPADFDGDCEVAASDLAQLLGSWGPCP